MQRSPDDPGNEEPAATLARSTARRLLRSEAGSRDVLAQRPFVFEGVEGRRYAARVEPPEALHVREDRAELLGEPGHLGLLELEAGEIRDAADLRDVDLHRSMIIQARARRVQPTPTTGQWAPDGIHYGAVQVAAHSR